MFKLTTARQIASVNAQVRTLKGAGFLQANLSAVDFTRADLSGADLTGANVWMADFRGMCACVSS
jgi:uncharacterized protein YjbI with pentapeptide repeats